MKGEPFKRCGCRDTTGKKVGGSCPRLAQRHHGAWHYRYSEPTGVAGRRRQPIAGPFPTKRAAEVDRIERLDQLNKGTHALTDRTVKLAADFTAWRDSRFTIKASTQRSLIEIGRRLVLIEGLWHTGGGLSAAQCRELVAAHRDDVIVRPLNESQLWGRAVADERYLLISRS